MTDVQLFEMPNGDVVCRDGGLELIGTIRKMSATQSPLYMLQLEKAIDGGQSIAGDNVQDIASVLRAALNPEPMKPEQVKPVDKSKGKKPSAN